MHPADPNHQPLTTHRGFIVMSDEWDWILQRLLTAVPHRPGEVLMGLTTDGTDLPVVWLDRKKFTPEIIAPRLGLHEQFLEAYPVFALGQLPALKEWQKPNVNYVGVA